ncbi:MAG: hypothetical protein J6T10_17780 [Methanobrevibacter sp.]|nr:hypothetical protein [Methanobrevibacter sp.]
MEYSVNETYDGYKCYLTVTFTEPILNYFRSNKFAINIDDLVKQSYISITSFTDLLNSYSIKPDDSTVFTTIDNQLDNSLIKNGGLIITFIDNKTIQFIIIPKCKNSQNTLIGFCNSKITIHIDSPTPIDAVINANLFPKVTRSDTLNKLYNLPDPVLPDDVDRCCYTYPNIYDSVDTTVKHNVTYPTESQIYVNTTTSGEIPLEGEVPVYISKVSAIFTEESSESLIPDWTSSSVSSVLYNEKNMTYVSVPWRFDTPDVMTATDMVIQQFGKNDGEPIVLDTYNTTLSSYNIEQFVFAENLPHGRYENKLFFGLDVKQNPDYIPPEPEELFTYPTKLSNNVSINICKFTTGTPHLYSNDRLLDIYTGSQSAMTQYGYDKLTLDLTSYPFLTPYDKIQIRYNYRLEPDYGTVVNNDDEIYCSTSTITLTGGYLIDFTPDSVILNNFSKLDADKLKYTVNLKVIWDGDRAERANNIRTMYEIDIDDPRAAGWDDVILEPFIWEKHVIDEEPATDNIEEETNNE